MKRFSFVSGCLAVLMAATTAGAVEPANRPISMTGVQPVSVSSLVGGEAEMLDHHGPYCECCEPLWNIYVGAVILKRESTAVFPGFDFGWQGGVEADIRRRLGTDYQLQVRYFGVEDWDDQQSIGPINAFNSSNLHSTEVNLRRDWTDRLSVLAGFRWVELGEDIGVGVGPIAVQNNTNNHMYGGQIGADWLAWDRGGPFTVTVGAKAGIYYNRADYDASLAFGPFVLANGNRESHTAFLGELAVTGAYQLSDNWAVRGGYQLLWIEGVALADANVVPAIFGADVNTSGSPFYHGATVGLEFRY